MSPWLLATRPKTLAAGFVPVAVGVGLAATVVPPSWGVAAGTLAGALLIQIGCNFANDAFDALKGADTAERQGPVRAVAAGLISPRTMLVATALVLLAAFAVGLWLTSVGGWPILVLGLVSIACAVGYTAGPLPLAYVGLGDLFVFLFFGLAAVLGTAWLQVMAGGSAVGARLELPWPWWAAAAAVGLQATALIAINNLRDIATDAPVGKRTLAVRLGARATRWYHLCLHLAATACWFAATTALPALGLAALAALIGGILLARRVFLSEGAALNACLANAAKLELACGVLAVVGLAVLSRP